MEGEKTGGTLDLMQPEVMSVDTLRHVLSQRLVSRDVLEAPKYVLVDLWHRLVTPHPQRTYRDNRAGRWYAARQRRPAESPRQDSADDSRDWSDISKIHAIGGATVPSSVAGGHSRVTEPSGVPPIVSTAAPPGVSRLKPPPAAAAAGEKRVIRLSTSQKRPAENSLDQIVIKRRNSAGGGKAVNTEPGPEARVKVTSGHPSTSTASNEGRAVGTNSTDLKPAHSGGANGISEDTGADIKAKLKQEKRKIKIKRRPSALESEAKRVSNSP